MYVAMTGVDYSLKWPSRC